MDRSRKKRTKPTAPLTGAALLPSKLTNVIDRTRRVTRDRILRLPRMCEKSGRAGATAWKDVGEGTFPPPVSIGPRAVGWRESEIDAWLEACSFSTRCPEQPFDMKVFIAELIAVRDETDQDGSEGIDQHGPAK